MTDPVTTPISPCPFCGSTNLKVDSKHHGKHYYEGTHSATVRCQKCHARGPTASCKVTRAHMRVDESTMQKAIELWNNQVVDEFDLAMETDHASRDGFEAGMKSAVDQVIERVKAESALNIAGITHYVVTDHDLAMIKKAVLGE